MSPLAGIPPISQLQPLSQLNPTGQIDAKNSLNNNNGASQTGSDFSKFLNDALQKVDALQKDADVASIALATGQTQDLHTAMIALEKASLSLSLTVEVRNKVLDAYHEVMRMQI